MPPITFVESARSNGLFIDLKRDINQLSQQIGPPKCVSLATDYPKLFALKDSQLSQFVIFKNVSE